MFRVLTTAAHLWVSGSNWLTEEILSNYPEANKATYVVCIKLGQKHADIFGIIEVTHSEIKVKLIIIYLFYLNLCFEYSLPLSWGSAQTYVESPQLHSRGQNRTVDVFFFFIISVSCLSIQKYIKTTREFGMFLSIRKWTLNGGYDILNYSEK